VRGIGREDARAALLMVFRIVAARTGVVGGGLTLYLRPARVVVWVGLTLLDQGGCVVSDHDQAANLTGQSGSGSASPAGPAWVQSRLASHGFQVDRRDAVDIASILASVASSSRSETTTFLEYPVGA
jgi:hypothetical protein